MAVRALTVFTDGAAKGNPGPAGWGYVLRLGDETVEEAGGGVARATNNQMEMTAALRALERCAGEAGRLTVLTDSSYLIQGITGWIRGWKRRGWKTASGGAVLNRELWEALDAAVGARAEAVDWVHVPGHAGVPGNERADAVASAFASGGVPDLYRGAAADYTVDLDRREPSAGAGAGRGASSSRSPRGSARASSGGKAFSYVSLVDGRLRRHRSWAECEAVVRGRSGARFRKAGSAEEERAIVRSWGRDPGELDS